MITTTTKPRTEKFKYGARFQDKVLRLLYQETDFAVVVAPYLKPDLFGNKIQRWLAGHLLNYIQRYNSCPEKDALLARLDTATRIGKIKGSEEEAARITIKKLSRLIPDRAFIKDEVFRFTKSMHFRNSFLNAAEKYEKDDIESADAIMQEYFRLSLIPGGPGLSYTGNLKVRSRARKEYKPNGIPTGTDLDDYFSPGGLPPKRLGVFVAPPGRGKSLSLVHLAKSAAVAGYKALYVTMELLEDDIIDRLDAAFAGVFLGSLRAKGVTVKRAVLDVRKKYGDPIRVKFFPPQTLTVAGLRGYLLQQEKLGFKPDLLLIDFADYMKPTKDYDSAYDELGLIYQELKNLAVESNVAIWTACFTGDTLIDTPAGPIPIKDLVGRVNVPVYCYDQKKKEITISRMNGCWLDSKAAKLVKVVLDNKEEIRCTPNHPFMLRDGSYRFAEDLRPGDSLMPLHRARYWYGKKLLKKINVNGTHKGWRYESHVVAEWKYKRKLAPGEIVHHEDENHDNDNPTNLKVKPHGQHISDHRKTFNPMWDAESRAKAGRGVRRAWRINSNMKLPPVLSGSKNPQKRPEVAAKTAKGVARVWASMTAEQRAERGAAISRGKKAARMNHKVVAVETLLIREPVYNMEVAKHHNFVLAAGVVVKNSQGNRASVRIRRVDTDSMADSFKKAGIADVIIGISQSDKEKVARVARLGIVKSRIGPSGVEIKVRLLAAKSQIVSMRH